jgi:hypothetical protein
MHPMDGDSARRPARWWLLLALAGASSSGCSPTQIAEERFQSRQQTCYEFPEGVDGGPPVQDSYWSDTQRPEGCKGQLASTPVVSTSAGGAGSGVAASAGAVSAGVVSGGAASSALPPGQSSGARADAGVPIGGDLGSSAPPGGAGSPLPAGCNEQEILERFARPAKMGGCTDPDGLGCHESGTGEDPVLSEPSQTLRRLLDQQDPKGCERVWIPTGAKKPEEAFLYRRLTQNVSDEDCEVQMPLMEEPLESATLACIAAWIVWVANGRQP